MYKQTLVKTVTPVKPNVIKRLNRYNKWEYGYNKEHDIIVISRSGKIGEIIEIQNLCIALPPVPKEIDNNNNMWAPHEFPKELNNVKSIFDWETYPESFKNKWYAYIDREFTRREEGYWFNNKNKPTYITGSHYICTCSTPKLMLGNQIIGKQTDYFLYSGKHAKQIKGVTECATSRIDGLDLALCHQRKLLTKLQLHQMLDLEYYQNPVVMLKKCSQIKWYQYQSTIRSFSNQYKTGWTDQNQNWHTGYQHPNSLKNR